MLVPSGTHAKYRTSRNAESPCNPRYSRAFNPKNHPLGSTKIEKYFAAALSDFAGEFDWSTDGPLKGLGGEGDVKTAVDLIRDARKKAKLKVVANG
jgi:hypothetical protein